MNQSQNGSRRVAAAELEKPSEKPFLFGRNSGTGRNALGLFKFNAELSAGLPKDLMGSYPDCILVPQREFVLR